MKSVKLLVAVVAVLMFGVNIVQAQFTLLPTREEGDDCNQILSEFELHGDFQTAKNNSMQQAFDETEKMLVQAEQAKDDSYESLQLSQVAVDDTRNTWQACFNQGSNVNCDAEQNAYEQALAAKKSAMDQNKAAVEAYDSAKTNADTIGAQLDSSDVQADDSQFRDTVLACAIQTGRISLSMIPYFIKYIADFLLGLSGIVTVLFFVVGGYFYIWGGLTDNKEKGKKTVINAIIGLIIALLSWAIVSMIIATLTS